MKKSVQEIGTLINRLWLADWLGDYEDDWETAVMEAQQGRLDMPEYLLAAVEYMRQQELGAMDTDSFTEFLKSVLMARGSSRADAARSYITTYMDSAEEKFIRRFDRHIDWAQHLEDEYPDAAVVECQGMFYVFVQ